MKYVKSVSKAISQKSAEKFGHQIEKSIIFDFFVLFNGSNCDLFAVFFNISPLLIKSRIKIRACGV